MKVCTYCRHTMGKHDVFCPKCGNAEFKYICAHCGKELPDDKYNYCGKCRQIKGRGFKAARNKVVENAGDFRDAVENGWDNVADRLKDIDIAEAASKVAETAAAVQVAVSGVAAAAKKIANDINTITDSADTIKKAVKKAKKE